MCVKDSQNDSQTYFISSTKKPFITVMGAEPLACIFDA